MYVSFAFEIVAFKLKKLDDVLLFNSCVPYEWALYLV